MYKNQPHLLRPDVPHLLSLEILFIVPTANLRTQDNAHLGALTFYTVQPQPNTLLGCRHPNISRQQHVKLSPLSPRCPSLRQHHDHYHNHGLQTNGQPGRAPQVRTFCQLSLPFPRIQEKRSYHHTNPILRRPLLRFAEPEQRHPTPSSSQYAQKPLSPRPAANNHGRLSPQPPNAAGYGAHTSYSQQPQHPKYNTMSPPPVAAAQRPAPVQNRPPPASRPPPSPAPGEERDPTLLPLFRAVDKNGTPSLDLYCSCLWPCTLRTHAVVFRLQSLPQPDL